MSISKTQDYSRLNELKVGSLQSFNIRKGFDSKGDVVANVTLEILHNNNKSLLKIKFYKATDIKVGNLNSREVMILIINDIRSHQLEDARYRAVDEEAAIISLNCWDFEFVVE
jgi:hypothetical protein